MGVWNRWYAGILRGVEWALMALTGALAVVVPVGVLFRYGLGSALAWTDELGAFLLAWITYLGGVVALHRRSHMGFDNLVERLPGAWRTAVGAVMDLTLAGFFFILLVYGLQITVELAGQQAISMPLSMGLVYGVMPLSASLMVLVLVHKYAEAAQKALARAGRRRGETAVARETASDRQAAAPGGDFSSAGLAMEAMKAGAEEALER